MQQPTPRILQTGLCAFGMSGQVFHAPFLKMSDGFAFSAVVERHAKKAAEKYPGVKSYPSVEAMLADSSLELVIVNTPNGTHYEYAKQALLAGKHVIVEKPFAATLPEAQELASLAAARQRLLVVFQNRRWDSDFQAVKQVVEQRLLGELIEAEFHYDRYRLEPSYKQHKEVPGPGVGNIYDLGPHLIDQAICLFGRPEKLFAIIQAHRPGLTVDDYFEIKLLYPNFTATLKSSILAREPVPAFILHGVKGSFLKTRSDIQETELQEGKTPDTPGWGEEPAAEAGLLHTTVNGKEVRERMPSPPGRYAEFLKGVYRSIVNGDPSPVPLEDSLLNMQIIEAARQSSREQVVVAIES